MFRRFGSRRAVGSRIKASASDPLAAILGANLIDYWNATDALRVDPSGEVTSITGRLYGLTLTAAVGGFPVYTAVDATLNDQPSISTAPGSVLVNSAVPADFIPAGHRPFLFVIGYITVSPEPGVILLAVSALRAGGWSVTTQEVYNSGGDIPWQTKLTSGANYVADGPQAFGAEFIPYVHGSVVDAAAGTFYWQDGVSYTPNASGTAVTATALTDIVLGSSIALTDSAYVTWAVAGICSDAPSGAERDALYTYAQATYGVP